MRPLALPALLVGDARLGGISSTLCAYESLLLRGHQTVALAMTDDGPGGGLGNADAVALNLAGAAAHRLGAELPVVRLPQCAPPPPPAKSLGSGSSGNVSSSGSASQEIDRELAAWLAASAPAFDSLLQLLLQDHERRLTGLRSAPRSAMAGVWWPFTQHGRLGTRCCRGRGSVVYVAHPCCWLCVPLSHGCTRVVSLPSHSHSTLPTT